jgi:hypothetical protein
MLRPEISDNPTIPALKPCVSNEFTVSVTRDANPQIRFITVAPKPDKTCKSLG